MTSELLGLCRALGVSEATFWKWRAQGLIPDPFPVPRRGRGRGLGRFEAVWPASTVRQVEEIYRLRQRGLRHTAIAVELWLSGYEVKPRSVRAGMTHEFARLLRQFETVLNQIEVGTPSEGGYRSNTVRRFARVLVRKTRPHGIHSSRADREAAEEAWQSMSRLVLPKTSGLWAVPKDRGLPAALGLPEEFGSFFDDAQQITNLLNALRGLFDREAAIPILQAAPEDTLVIGRRLTIGLGMLIALVRELPEGASQVPPQWAALLRVVSTWISSIPRVIWLVVVVLLLRGIEVSDELLAAFDSIEKACEEVQEARRGLAGRMAGGLRQVIQAAPVAND